MNPVPKRGCYVDSAPFRHFKAEAPIEQLLRIISVHELYALYMTH
jgi:hypothetical protein